MDTGEEWGQELGLREITETKASLLPVSLLSLPQTLHFYFCIFFHFLPSASEDHLSFLLGAKGKITWTHSAS